MTNISDLNNTKKENSLLIRSTYSLNKTAKPLGLIKISNEENLNAILPWLAILPWVFVVVTQKTDKQPKNISFTKTFDESLISWFDFVLTDELFIDFDLLKKSGVVPVVHKDLNHEYLLEEFSAKTSEGNSYLFEHISYFDMYYAVVRYFENFKFTFDNKILVNNLVKS